MKFKSQVYTQVSGSVGGLTYAHAKGGTMYSRARAIPVNPNTPFQVTVRNLMAFLVNAWTSTLSSAQRNTWDMYGQNVPVTNALGDSVTLSGQNWFIGANLIRSQSDVKLASTLGLIQTAPVVFNRGDLTAPGGIAYDVTTGFSLSYTNTDSWAIADGGALLVFQGRPRNPSRLSFKGPWRLIAVEEGAATPPTSPLTVSAAVIAGRGFAITAGEFISTAVVAVQPDGRYTTRFIQPSVVAT